MERELCIPLYDQIPALGVCRGGERRIEKVGEEKKWRSKERKKGNGKSIEKKKETERRINRQNHGDRMVKFMKRLILNSKSNHRSIHVMLLLYDKKEEEIERRRRIGSCHARYLQ